MAWAALGGSELQANLLAQLAQNGSSAQRLTAPSRAVCNTTPLASYPASWAWIQSIPAIRCLTWTVTNCCDLRLSFFLVSGVWCHRDNATAKRCDCQRLSDHPPSSHTGIWELVGVTWRWSVISGCHFLGSTYQTRPCQISSRYSPHPPRHHWQQQKVRCDFVDSSIDASGFFNAYLECAHQESVKLKICGSSLRLKK